MKFLNTLFFIIISTTLSIAQNQDIIGETSKEKLLSTSHQGWFNSNYEDYKPKSETIEKLNHIFNKNDFKVEVYFGTWCSDSQREVPRLIKLLEKANFDFDQLMLVGVGRDKKVPNVSDKQQRLLNITNVPTIIVYQDGQELNRFVEYAQESLEKDMLKIFTKEKYKHSYQY